MTQYARPSSDFLNSTWTSSAGGSLFEDINEASQSDTDYIISQANIAGSVYVTKLSSVSDPSLSTGHVLRYTYRRSATNKNGTITIELRQGYVSEGSLGTLIRTDTYTNPAATFTAANITLSASEADAITNYGDLYIRFYVDVNAGGGLTLQSSWAVLDVPDSSVQTLSVQDAAVTTQVDAASISKQSTLIVQDAFVTSQADAVVLDVPAPGLLVDDGNAVTTVDNVTLLIAPQVYVSWLEFQIPESATPTISVQDASVTTQVDAVVTTKQSALTVQDAAVTTQVDIADISKQSTLSVQDASVTTQVDAVVTTKQSTLIVQDASVTTQVDATTVSTEGALSVQDASVTTQVDSISITKQSTLIVQDAYVTTQVDNVGTAIPGTLSIDDAFVTTQSDNVSIYQQHQLSVADAYVTSQADTLIVSQTVSITLSVQDAAVTTQVDSISITKQSTLSVQDASVTIQVDAVSISKQSTLSVQDAAVVTYTDFAYVTIVYILNVHDANVVPVSDFIVMNPEEKTILANDVYLVTVADEPVISKQSTLVVSDAVCVVVSDKLSLTAIRSIQLILNDRSEELELNDRKTGNIVAIGMLELDSRDAEMPMEVYNYDESIT